MFSHDGYVILLAVCGFLVAYTYVLYPLFLLTGARFITKRPPPARTQRRPLVSIVVAAHNEETVIEDKILNTRALEYPTECLEFLVGSDASTDRTDEICRRHADVTFERIEPRLGKANILNTLIPKARGEIVVLSDANSILDAEAISSMVRHFADPTVGGVCGHLVLVSDRRGIEDTERTYWDYESKIKELESHWYSTIGANGGLYAIRKELFAPIAADTIIDDFVISLYMLEQGKRLVFEPAAVAREGVSKSFRDLFWRKVRIGAGNLQALRPRRTFFYTAHPFVSFAYLSRKVIRWIVPFLLIVIWLCSFALSPKPPFSVLFWGLNLSFVLALAGVFEVSRNRLVMALAYVYSLNLALLVGYGRYALGFQNATWPRAER